MPLLPLVATFVITGDGFLAFLDALPALFGAAGGVFGGFGGRFLSGNLKLKELPLGLARFG